MAGSKYFNSDSEKQTHFQHVIAGSQTLDDGRKARTAGLEDATHT
jgi:hypothetical protein